MKRKFHAPFWSSGRRSDPPIDCNGTRPAILAFKSFCFLVVIWLVCHLPFRVCVEKNPYFRLFYTIYCIK